MKKTLALVLALAMVFSTITVAFAEGTIGGDAQICADLGMLKGSTGTVDAAYVATAPTRIQAAVMFLRLKGLEAEAMAFTGAANFADAGKAAWATPIMAYLKANPQLGWMGDGTNFDPMGLTTAQAYYKVMLEALGYKQTTPEVVGDFAYADVMTFAASKGLTKVAAVTNYTVNDLAIATVEALKANMKDGGKTLVATLVDAGKVDKAKAVAAGLIVEAPAVVALPEVDEVAAVGSAVVEVTFEDDVDAATAANVANYAIEGLAINAATVADTDRVRLDTAVMSAGKLYTLTVAGKAYKVTGIAKVSGAPEIADVVGEDIEEVEITFTKSIDLATGSNVANYSIAGVEVAKAVVDGDTVTLTTVGLKNKTKYTVKVTNVKSVDGSNKKSDTDSFSTNFDSSAPKLNTVVAETNQRLKVTFSEKVTEASAENLANYAVKIDEKDGEALEVVSVEWDSDDKNFVFVTTEAMENNEDYTISVNGIVDRRKAANTMTRPSSKDFEGVDEDEDAPRVAAAVAIAPTKILVTFTDESRLDEASATNLANYELEDLNIDEITVVEDEYQVFRALLTVEDMETGENYDLTVDGVADEFGNAIEDSEKSVRASANNIGAVAVTAVTATGENTIVVQFDGELDETSAENIANYSIDEDLGAPTKAEWEKTGAAPNTVTLTVNDMVNGLEFDRYGKAYDLTVDGVLDLSGNELYYEFEVDTIPVLAASNWDDDAAKVEDVEAIDTNVVAVTFDEKVEFRNLAELELAVNGNWNNIIELTAADYNDEDTVIEFTYGLGLLEDVSFTVYRFVYEAGEEDGGIWDSIGNVTLQGDIEFGEFTFDGVDDAHLGVEIDSYTQRDARQFEVTMEREVALETAVDNNYDADPLVGTAIDNAGIVTLDGIDWLVTLKGSNHKVVRFTVEAGQEITEDTDYEFDFNAFLNDKHGYNVANVDNLDDDDTLEATVLTGEFTDEDTPYVDEVVAKNRTHIKVTFNERMDSSSFDISDFALKNYDLDEDITITGLFDETNGDGIIELVVTRPLEARYEYQLTIGDKEVNDHAGLLNQGEESFYFNGSNLK